MSNRKYKKISLNPDKVSVLSAQVLPHGYQAGPIDITRYTSPNQTHRYAMLVSTNDLRTFNRLVSRLSYE